MKEINSLVDPKETEVNKKRFPQAIDILKNSIGILAAEKADAYTVEDEEGNALHTVDKDVIEAMKGGITRMYDDLVSAGEADFANSVIDKHTSL